MSKNHKPAIKDLAVVFIVKDLQRTQAFYDDTLGLKLEIFEGFMQGAAPGGVALMFFPGEPQTGTSPQIVFGLADGGIDDVAAAWAARGVSLLTPVSEAPGGFTFDFADPDGHSLSVYQEEALPRAR